MSLTGKMEDEREANAYERGYNDGMKKQMKHNAQKEAEIRADERVTITNKWIETHLYTIISNSDLADKYRQQAVAQLFKELDAIFESGFDKSIFRQYLALKKKHGII